VAKTTQQLVSMGNYIIFNNTTVQKNIFFVGLSSFKKSFFVSYFPTEKEVKSKKILESTEMIIWRGVDRRVVGFKVKKTRVR
jgi:hypothetical protein